MAQGLVRLGSSENQDGKADFGDYLELKARVPRTELCERISLELWRTREILHNNVPLNSRIGGTRLINQEHGLLSGSGYAWRPKGPMP